MPYFEFEVLAEEFIADFGDSFLQETRRSKNVDDGNQTRKEILCDEKK